MTKTLNIGTRASNGKPFTLPLDLITQTVAILAKRGVGKTTTGAVISEELMDAGQRICVIDPTGAHWGLKSTADGKGAAYPVVIFGGEHADAPLEKSAGEVLARAIAEGDFSCIIDLSAFRKGETIQFLTSFFEEIYRLNRRPLHLVCDEADTYAPQKPLPNQLQCLGAIEDVIKKGRIRGLGATLITLRSAIINKNVLAMCEILVAMRAVHPLDIAPVKEWVSVHGDPETAKTLIASLPSLPVGAAWFYSPGWGDIFERVQVRPRRTFDSSATPKPGAKVARPKVLAKVDMERLSAQIKATIEEAKANSVPELKRQIAALRTELEKKPKTEQVVKEVEKIVEVKVPALTDAQVTRLEKVAQKLTDAVNKHREAAQEILLDGSKMVTMLTAALAPPATPQLVATGRFVPAVKAKETLVVLGAGGGAAAVPAPSAALEGQATETKIRPGAIKILRELASRMPAGYTRAQVGGLVGFGSKGGTFKTYVSTLKSLGYIEDRDGKLYATAAGAAHLGGDVPAAPTTHAEAMALWRKALRSGAYEMLEVIVRAGMAGISRADLGAAVNAQPSGGTFKTYVSTMKSNGLVTESNGLLVANDILFPG